MNHSSQNEVPSRDTSFNDYFESHVSAAYSSAVRRLGIDHADDIVTEAFTIAWQKQAHLLEAGKGRAWLLTTVAYLCMNTQRSAARELSKAKDAAYLTQLSLNHPPPDNERFWEAWRKLPLGDQEILASVYWDDIPYMNLAQLHGSSEGAIRTRVSRAKSRLNKLLRPQFKKSTVSKGATR